MRRYGRIAACTLDSSGCVHDTDGHSVFAFGLAADDAAASAMIRDSTDGASGSVLWVLSATASTYAGQAFAAPLHCACGVYVTVTGAGASAMVAWG